MNIETGYIRRLGPDEKPDELEVAIPDGEFERVVNMTRQVRRAWARAQAKRLRGQARETVVTVEEVP